MNHAPNILPLYGIPCGRCGQPGDSHDTQTGYTAHLDRRLPNCSTKPPAALVAGTNGARP